MEKKVCICLLPIIGSYYGLQDLTVELKSDLDPGIRITFASDHEITQLLVTAIHNNNTCSWPTQPSPR